MPVAADVIQSCCFHAERRNLLQSVNLSGPALCRLEPEVTLTRMASPGITRLLCVTAARHRMEKKLILLYFGFLR